MKITDISQLKGRYILFENKDYLVKSIEYQQAVYKLITDSKPITIVKVLFDDFLERILVSDDREDIADYVRETPEEKILEIKKEATSDVSESPLEEVTPETLPVIAERPEHAAIIAEVGFVKPPIETTIEKHGKEISQTLMDVMKGLRAGTIKKDQAESICAVARELQNQSKEEISLIKALRNG
jgi:hypothetical protein